MGNFTGRNSKRITAALLSFVLAVGVAGCGAKEEKDTDSYSYEFVTNELGETDYVSEVESKRGSIFDFKRNSKKDSTEVGGSVAETSAVPNATKAPENPKKTTNKATESSSAKPSNPTKTQLEKFPLTIATANKRKGLISAGFSHTAALRKDGTVAITKIKGSFSEDYKRPEKVDDWKNIKYICARDGITLGVKSNGRVVKTGFFNEENNGYIIDVSKWRDIKEVSASMSHMLDRNAMHVIGLKNDGTVVDKGDSDFGECDTYNWKNIEAIDTGWYHTVGLRKDGTVISTKLDGPIECDDHGQTNVSQWKDIVAVAVGGQHTVGLKKDGTVVATGDNNYGQCNVSGWKDIIAISACDMITVGLKNDGTVVATGSNDFGQCNVSKWRDIVAISAGSNHVVGLKKDGKAVAVGMNDMYNQCDVASWYGLKTP